jgi:hypothetical protein
MGKPKLIISVSLGSSERNHEAETVFLGQEFLLKRFGTDGELGSAAQMLCDYDGIADAIGLGGVDEKVRTKWKTYSLRDGRRLAAIPKKTPVVDGGGLKNTLEPLFIERIAEEGKVPIKRKKVLLVSAMDRLGMHGAFLRAKCKVICGDLFFALGIPIPVRSQFILALFAFFLMPIVSRLPHSWIYPTGKSQDHTNGKENRSLFGKVWDFAIRLFFLDRIYEFFVDIFFYRNVSIVAGDWHYIHKAMPYLKGKIVITNTVTTKNVDELRNAGVTWLVTTTPNFPDENGVSRSFGTNVLEAALLALSGKRPEEITPQDYLELIKKLDLQPRIELLN